SMTSHFALAVALAAAASAAAARRVQAPASRFVLASVVDTGGEPVAGLTADAFVVQEGGIQWQALNAAPRQYPVAILVATRTADVTVRWAGGSGARPRSVAPRPGRTAARPLHSLCLAARLPFGARRSAAACRVRRVPGICVSRQQRISRWAAARRAASRRLG